MPAYNAEATLQKTISDIPFDYIDEILLVDDASKDGTVELARKIGSHHPKLTMSPAEYQNNEGKILFTIIKHDKNRGYGGNQKSCYNTALAHGADIVVMLHSDYQYDPRLVKYFVEFIRDGYFDVMLGSRIRSRKEAIASGMPIYKYYANRVLTFIENIASGRVLSEWHTGMRAYTKEVLKNINYNKFSDDFIFDTQALFAIAEKGYSIGDIPVPVRYFEEASSINFARSVRYGILTVWETIKFLFRNLGQFFRYLIAGVTGVLVNLSFYAFLLYQAHIWYIYAAFIAFCCGAVVSFTLQKFWTFKRQSLDKIHYEILIYVSLAIFNAFANGFILFILVQKISLGKLVANILSNGIVAIWSFFVYKHIAFKKRSDKII